MSDNRRTRALITRPQEDSAEVAIAMVRRRITPILAPMMRVEYRSANIDEELSHVQAVLFTSRNGVRAFSRLSGRRDIKVFSVGDSTATLARDEGFNSVLSAEGDSSDLAALLIEQLSPSDGTLLHVAGASVAGQLTETLEEAGFEVFRRTLYEAKPVTALPQKTIEIIKNNEVDYVVFFSPRTAQIFLQHIEVYKLGDACRSIIALSLSQSVARELGKTEWRDIVVATIPTTQSLLHAMDVIEKREPSSINEGSHVSPPNYDQNFLPETRVSKSNEGSRDARVVEERAEELLSSEDIDFSSEDVPMINTRLSIDQGVPGDRETDMTDTAYEKPTKPKTNKLIYFIGFSGAIVSVLLALFIAYFTLPYWRDFLPEHVKYQLNGGQRLGLPEINITGQLEEMQRSITASRLGLEGLTKRLRKLEESIVETRGLESRLTENDRVVAGLKDTLGELEGLFDNNLDHDVKLDDRLAEVENNVNLNLLQRGEEVQRATEAGSHTAREVRRLEQLIIIFKERIESLEAQFSEMRQAPSGPEKSNLIALSIGQLRESLKKSQPFAAEFYALQRLAKNNRALLDAVAPVEKLASQGIPTRQSLLKKVPKIIGIIIETGPTPVNKDWVERAVSEIRNVVKIRRIDGKGTGLEAVIARAELSARNDDLDGVIGELTTLRGVSGSVVEDWLVHARARVLADTVIIELNKAVLSAFSPNG